jgi:hypothetical protein
MTASLKFGLALAIAAGCAAPGAPAERRTENVLLVTFDGLRWQEVFRGAEDRLMTKANGGVEHPEALRERFWRDTPEARRDALLPFLWQVVAREGQLFGNGDAGGVAVVTNGKKFSYPGYNEILAGFADPRIDSNDKRFNPNGTVLGWLARRPGFAGRVAAFGSWDAFPFIIAESREGVYVNAGNQPVAGLGERQALLNALMAEIPLREESVRHDALTFRSALEYLRAKQPRVLYVSFDETDGQAHAGRYDLVLAAAQRTDGFVRELWDAVQAMPRYAGKTSLVITTDHGRGDGAEDWKEHGVTVAGAERIWIAVIGPDTPALGPRTSAVTQSQVAATVAALLGLDYAADVSQAGPPIAGALR